MRQNWGVRRIFRQVAPLSISALMFLLLASTAKSEVTIDSPSNNATVSGTITVKAQVDQAWWSKLWIDGNGGPTAATGLVTFTWNSTTVADGSHVLTVDGYPSGKPANAADSITVVVNNHGSSSSSSNSLVSHFGTLPASASLPDDATCASEIGSEPEMIPANEGSNNTMPTEGQLSDFADNGYAAVVGSDSSIYARVDGQYTGTTDMIFRWAACKWGIDEDLVRAQASMEDWAWNQPDSGGDKRTSYSQCVNGNFTSLWNYQCSSCCYQSWSIFQTKVYYDWMTWPMMVNSTAFGADYHYASMRSCMNGDLASYFAGRASNNGHTYSADIKSGNLNTILWGCVGYHYSGNWYDGDSSSGAIFYIDAVQSAMSQKSWKTRWPSVNWPD